MRGTCMHVSLCVSLSHTEGTGANVYTSMSIPVSFLYVKAQLIVLNFKHFSRNKHKLGKTLYLLTQSCQTDRPPSFSFLTCLSSKLCVCFRVCVGMSAEALRPEQGVALDLRVIVCCSWVLETQSWALCKSRS